MSENGASSHSQPNTFTLPLRPRVSNLDATMMAAAPKTATMPPVGLSSPGISVEFHGDPTATYDLPEVRSAPADVQKFQSPMRHHKRTPSTHFEVKETLNARSEYTGDDGDGIGGNHRINQYVIKQEIGRGSYGAVHLATDQFGNEFAVKEFSKARLRKRAQSNILRNGPRRPGGFPGRAGFGAPDAPSARMTDQRAREAKDALFLIREEIAIMKKLNHPNLVRLIEVLDDPEEDSLYMVLEMCKKGVVMNVGLNETATPKSKEECRYWFRDLILGIEYLHSQGVVHRDIKPDNLLLTEDNVLKIVDFGVSEMFEKPENMRTAKPAGSPAFLPPELCVAKHGDVDGKAADIWSMGVSLYCLYYGRLPFERAGVLDMYEAIKTENAPIPEDEDPQFVDLMNKLLEKNPEKRITMDQLREHPWVTKEGEDPLLSAEENCSEPVEPPNALEVNHAFTRRMSHLLCVMRAIRKFKALLGPEGANPLSQDPVQHLGGADSASTTLHPSSAAEGSTKQDPLDTSSTSTEDEIARIIRERQEFLKANGGPRGIKFKFTKPVVGQANDVTSSAPLHLGIGTGAVDDFAGDQQPPADFVSDSPTAVEFNIYDRAFDAEIERIKRSTSRKRGSGGGGGVEIYHTRLNSYGQRHYKTAEGGGEDAKVVDGDKTPRSEQELAQTAQRGGRFANLAAQMMEAKSKENVGVPGVVGDQEGQ
ncbi:Protein kinase-like domain containing protein [Naviculisporaceae sp. PSN 640]